MDTENHIYPVLPIRDLINKDGKPTTPFKLETGTKPPILYLRALFCSCVVGKYTARVGTKALNMHHQAQKGFRGIFFGITQHQKGYLVYLPHKQNIVLLYDVVFDEIFYSAFEYTSQTYEKAMAMRPAVSYITHATSTKKQTGNIITFTHFEEGNLLSETLNYTKIGNNSDNN